ncbi:oligopeptide/dipeptide ABC transporter, ATPase subunit [Rhizobium sp. CF080]|uniref:ABC transporter ATP-binding protein n=1 Tax=Rhizobium sp. (strain CF080) TaxID=1144310 RepID=UPI000271925C|nr:oligopeptide/dipeptide ABC transporter ATP-binding protein [Rhizobium sp. CF080]EUB99985.1 oligopeptide/dipeptide ABC transporter, ATPase subunit [Rhizobium sp. CF080]
MTIPLIEASCLEKTFGSSQFLSAKKPVRAVSDVSITINRGEAVGLVGESGSGKSTIGRLLLNLIPLSGGSVTFDGETLDGMNKTDLRRLRQRMQIIFQDPYSSFDPRRRIGSQINDALKLHTRKSRSERESRIADLLVQVGLRPEHAQRFPHEFSGGQRQRIGIARALATEPDFIVADEPVSALDVSVQAQILALLIELRETLNLTLLFISHDLLVVKHLCNRVVVLYLGRIMEEGSVEAVFSNPRHPYTAVLLSAIPRVDADIRPVLRIALRGDPPSPANPPSGCVFRTRCPFAIEACSLARPALREVSGGHRIACIRDDISFSGLRAGTQM